MSDVIDRFYADYLGCSLETLLKPGISVGVQSEERRYNGVFVLRHGDACVFSAPHGQAEWVANVLRGKSVLEVWGVNALLELFGTHVLRIIGPVWLGYLERASFRPSESYPVRMLSRADARALWDLEVACAPMEWQHAGIGLDLPAVVGCEVNRRFVSVAGYRLWSKEMAHIGVVTRPAFRGQGYGKTVVSTLTSYGMAHGLSMQYRALEDNMPSIGIATGLGFQQYATTYSVRMNFPSAD